MNHRPRDQSSKVRELSTNESPNDTMDKEKVEMCVVERGMRSKTTRSTDRVAQGVRNNANIVVAKVENDESTTVDNDVQFKTLLTGVALLRMRRNKRQILIGVTITVLHLKACLVYASAGPNLIDADIWNLNRNFELGFSSHWNWERWQKGQFTTKAQPSVLYRWKTHKPNFGSERSNTRQWVSYLDRQISRNEFQEYYSGNGR